MSISKENKSLVGKGGQAAKLWIGIHPSTHPAPPHPNPSCQHPK